MVQQEADKDQLKTLKTQVFDQDMAELDNLQGAGNLASSRNPYEYDEVAARHSRVVNEYENFIEDKSVVDQQTVRLSHDQTSSHVVEDNGKT